MPRIILTKGLPASGKSTWARKQQDDHPGKFKRVNKDDLRAMLDNGRWSEANEKFVLNLRDHIITTALKENYDVIVDDTNLHPKHLARMQELAREVGNTQVDEQDFTEVPLQECIERDLKRSNSVGERVIKKMYHQFLKPSQTYQPDPKLPLAIICDIDGTLALFGEKNPYERDFENDAVNAPVADLVKRFKSQTEKLSVILVSGRQEKHRAVTEAWLTRHQIPFDRLYMRPTGDTTKDFWIKQIIYEEYIQDKYHVLFVLDDRNQTVDLWRALGLPCFQVAEGDF